MFPGSYAKSLHNYEEVAVCGFGNKLCSCCEDSRSGTVLALPLVLCLGCTSGAKDTAMIFLVSQEFWPVRVILVSWKRAGQSSCFSLFVLVPMRD